MKITIRGVPGLFRLLGQVGYTITIQIYTATYSQKRCPGSVWRPQNLRKIEHKEAKRCLLTLLQQKTKKKEHDREKDCTQSMESWRYLKARMEEWNLLRMEDLIFS